MSITRKVIFPMVATLIFAAGSAHAINITIPDGAGTGTGWYSSAREDQEVETNCVATQRWDLEGFYLNGTVLSMVGGYDFVNGQDGYLSGDIFLDTNGTPVYGTDIYAPTSPNGYAPVTNAWGYDLAIDLNFTENMYTVYAIDQSTLLTAYYRQNDASNPFQLASTDSSKLPTGSFSYHTVGTYAGLIGDFHNVVSLDLSSFLAPGTEFYAHFTMGCGNDNLMGHGSTPVPEPGTLLLLGVGLVGLAGIRRRRRA